MLASKLTRSPNFAATKVAAIALGVLSAIVLFVNTTFIIERASAAGVELQGAGSTFVAPLLQAWINNFEKTRPDVAIHYDVVGSGEGVSRFQSGSVDFGASDAFVSTAEAAKIERGVVQVPSTAGMIVLAYNLPGV